jgi:hypothetical protein
MAGMNESRGFDQPMTKLSAKDEAKFQDEIKNTLWYNQYKNQYGEAPNLDSTDYDYRKAYLNGIKPQNYDLDPTIQHWPSTTKSGEALKNASHPTAWMNDFMGSTGTDPARLGLFDAESAWKYYNSLKK